MPSAFAAGAFAFYWTGVTHFCFGFVNQDLLRPSSRDKGKYLSLGTDIMIFLRLIPKELGRIVLGTLAEIGGREIGFDPAFFQTHDIEHSAVLGIANGKLGINHPLGTYPIH